jgi:CheY-like chemotaxis protein
MRVLVADDEPEIVTLLNHCLRTWGYEVEYAHRGDDAWSKLSSDDPPAIALVDWDMPGLSGLDLCRRIKASPRGASTYVMMLTGKQSKHELIEALESGADDVMSKPFHLRELQLRIAKGVESTVARPSAVMRAATTRVSGAVLGGKIRLERPFAEGGTATVWLGTHLALGIPVAIKFMKKPKTSVHGLACFEREAKAAACLHSEHIVRVYDHGIAEDGAPYLVMEYVEGETLTSRIVRTGPLPPTEVGSIIEQVGRALAEAHARGIVHRDVKPDNILLTSDLGLPAGCAKLADFGLARLTAAFDTNTDNPSEGEIVGTPSYMSPEHLSGRAGPDPALDLWGLAVSAVTALAGIVPFDGECIADVIKSICRAPPPVPTCMNPSLSPAIDAWFARACARAPKERFPTATALTNALRAACMDSARSRAGAHADIETMPEFR